MNKEDLVKAMEKYFGNDVRRIAHAKKVLSFAEQILPQEGGDPEIVIPAAIFHDIGIHVCERKYGSSAGTYQEKESPPIARNILEEKKYSSGLIDDICDIIGHHHTPGSIRSVNFQILCDADMLVNLPETFAGKPHINKEAIIEKVFVTKKGKAIARKLFLPS